MAFIDYLMVILCRIIITIFFLLVYSFFSIFLLPLACLYYIFINPFDNNNSLDVKDVSDSSIETD